MHDDVDTNYPFQFESNQRILRRDGSVEGPRDTPLYATTRYYSYAGDAFGSSLRTQRQYNFFPQPLTGRLAPVRTLRPSVPLFFRPPPRAAGNDAGRHPHVESRGYFLFRRARKRSTAASSWLRIYATSFVQMTFRMFRIYFFFYSRLGFVNLYM